MSPSRRLKIQTDPDSDTLCILDITNSGRWTKSRNPVILSVVHSPIYTPPIRRSVLILSTHSRPSLRRGETFRTKPIVDLRPSRQRVLWYCFLASRAAPGARQQQGLKRDTVGWPVGRGATHEQNRPRSIPPHAHPSSGWAMSCIAQPELGWA
jgi:hypothetical protein